MKDYGLRIDDNEFKSFSQECRDALKAKEARKRRALEVIIALTGELGSRRDQVSARPGDPDFYVRLMNS